MTDRRPLSPEHDKHDRVLVARYAAGDAYPGESHEAELLVSGCDECAALAADIRLISTRITQLPAVARTRSFHITPDQAQQLRGSWIDRVMRRLAAPGWATARPLAGAALAIGLALVVIGALPFGNLGTSANSDAAPNFSYQAAGVPSSQLSTQHPQAPVAATQIAVDNGPGGAPGSAPAASGAPEKNDGGASVPTVGDANVEPTMPRDMSSEGSGVPQPSSATSVAPAAGATTAGAQSPEFIAATAAARTPEVAFVVPTAAPTPPPALGLAGQDTVSLTAASSLDRSLLIVAGLILAFLALMAIGLITVARRRYADPLDR